MLSIAVVCILNLRATAVFAIAESVAVIDHRTQDTATLMPGLENGSFTTPLS
jgi:hypothetical protein